MNGQALRQRIKHLEKKRSCIIGPILRAFYRIKVLRPLSFRMLCELEGGTMLSQTFILAVAPMKLIVRFGSLVTLINTIMFIYYIS